MYEYIINMEAMKKNCTSQSYQRGVKYYNQKRVRLNEVIDNVLEFTVRGQDDYLTTIGFDHNQLSYSCTCPYDWGGFCKHIIACMLYINANSKNIAYDLQDPYETNMGGSPHELDEEYATQTPVASRSPVQSLAASRNANSNNGKESQYLSEREIKKIIKDIAKKPSEKGRAIMERTYTVHTNKDGIIPNRDKVSFDFIKSVAGTFENEDKHQVAADIYKEMAQYISENIHIVDNSRRYYTTNFLYAMHGLMRTIKIQKDDHKKRQKYISYFLEMYLQDKTQFFASAYMEMLKNMCKSDDDLQYAIKIMDSQIKTLDSEHMLRSTEELLETKAIMLEDLGDESLLEFLSENSTVSESMYIKYARCIIESNPEEAKDIVKKGTKLFSDSTKIKEMACRIYEKTDSKYIDAMRVMFLSTYNWGYFEKIKEASNNWDEDLEKILYDIDRSNNPHMRMDILLHEGRKKDVLDSVISNKDTRMLDAYSHELGTIFPKEYHKEYADRIKQLVREARSEEDYTRIKDHVSAMSNIPKHKEKFAKFVDGLKNKNPQIAELLS